MKWWDGGHGTGRATLWKTGEESARSKSSKRMWIGREKQKVGKKCGKEQEAQEKGTGSGKQPGIGCGDVRVVTLSIPQPPLFGPQPLIRSQKLWIDLAIDST